MNKFSFIEYVDSLTPTGMKEGKENVLKLMKALGNPQDTLKVFHVTGSNGKGSVCQMISQVLSKGFHKKVGLFTSPHFIDLNERFQINGKLISDNELDRYYQKTLVLAKNEHIELSFFEIQVVVMVLYFVDQKVDYAVVEVGLGGTWDGTNIFSHPLACFITSITHEHTYVLGKTKTSILKNKLGIVKSGSILYSPLKNQIIANYCKKIGAKYCHIRVPVILGLDPRIQARKNTKHNWMFGSSPNMTKKYVGVLTNLPGIHQQQNALLVLQALSDIGFSEGTIKKSLKNIHNPGRLDWIAPNILVDTANNMENIKILAKMLEESTEYKVQSACRTGRNTKGLSPNSPSVCCEQTEGTGGVENNEKLTILFGTTQTNPKYAKELSQMVLTKERWYIDEFCDRALPCQAYLKMSEKSHILHWKHDKKAIKKLLQDKTKTILIYGSFYLVGEIMKLSRYKPFAMR